MDLKEIGINEHLGMITNETSTLKFSFLVMPLKNKKGIAKEDFITLDHPSWGANCPILARVTEVKSYEEVVGTTLGDKVGRILADAEIIGYINLKEEKKPVHQLLTPPNPGSRIHFPYTEFLEDIFTRDLSGKPFKSPIQVGRLKTEAHSIEGNLKPVKFYLNGEDLTSTHTLITAMDGAGKTHTATTIIEEIAKKTQTPIVIVDPYGEYNTIAKHTKRTQEIITHYNNRNPKNPAETIKQNQITTLNTENLTPEEKQKALSNQMEEIWKARLEKNAPSFLLVIEEPENIENKNLEAMTDEGAKHGIALILIAKHPAELGGKILSQTSTQIIGRTIDKDDIELLKNMALEKTTHLPKLRQGEWIVTGINIREPTEIITN